MASTLQELRTAIVRAKEHLQIEREIYDSFKLSTTPNLFNYWCAGSNSTYNKLRTNPPADIDPKMSQDILNDYYNFVGKIRVIEQVLVSGNESLFSILPSLLDSFFTAVKQEALDNSSTLEDVITADDMNCLCAIEDNLVYLRYELAVVSEFWQYMKNLLDGFDVPGFIVTGSSEVDGYIKDSIGISGDLYNKLKEIGYLIGQDPTDAPPYIICAAAGKVKILQDSVAAFNNYYIKSRPKLRDFEKVVNKNTNGFIVFEQCFMHIIAKQVYDVILLLEDIRKQTDLNVSGLKIVQDIGSKSSAEIKALFNKNVDDTVAAVQSFTNKYAPIYDLGGYVCSAWEGLVRAQLLQTKINGYYPSPDARHPIIDDILGQSQGVVDGSENLIKVWKNSNRCLDRIPLTKDYTTLNNTVVDRTATVANLRVDADTANNQAATNINTRDVAISDLEATTEWASTNADTTNVLTKLKNSVTAPKTLQELIDELVLTKL